MAPGRYTGLFFLDEATALAAGHRPCAECRNADYQSFLALTGASGADELDEMLHAERGRPTNRSWTSSPTARSWCSTASRGSSSVRTSCAGRPGGYSERRPRFSGRVELVTPPTSVRVLASGWAGSLPLIHPSRPS